LVKAWGRERQTGRIEEYQIWTLHFQRRARTIFLLCCEVGLTILLIRFVLIWTSSSHKEVLDIEIQFHHKKVVKKDPKLLIDRIRKMGSGEAPFFPATLSLVYDKLVEKAFTKSTPFRPGSSGRTEGQILPASSQASTSAPNINPPSTTQSAQLRCVRCYGLALLQDLRGGTFCPQCPRIVVDGNWPFMQCTLCTMFRTKMGDDWCENTRCGGRFT